MYSQPTALRMDLFSSTRGIPPSSVPAGQISLQKYGAPCPMISTTNIGSMITNTRKITYFSFRRSLSPRNVRIFFGKGILFNRSWISPKGREIRHTSLPSKCSDKDQKSSHIICHLEVPASDHSLKGTNGTGPLAPGRNNSSAPEHRHFSVFRYRSFQSQSLICDCL